MSSKWLYIYIRKDGTIGRSKQARHAMAGLDRQFVPESFAKLSDDRIRASFARTKRIQGLLEEMTRL